MARKLIAGLICIALAASTAGMTKASEMSYPSLAIIDTGIKANTFTNNIIHEVCIIEWYSCPNGDQFMEGKGAATLTDSLYNTRGFNHGTQMAATALATNNDLKIVFIRIIGNDSRGNRQGVHPNYLAKAFDWIAKNSIKFNINAVSISQGHHRLLNGKNYCPTSYAVNASIDSLVTQGIPVFASAGNLGDKRRIDWPSCIKNVTAVSSKDSRNVLSKFSNFDINLTDIVEFESINTTIYNYNVKSVGTSVSTQIAASKYIKEKTNG